MRLLQGRGEEQAMKFLPPLLALGAMILVALTAMTGVKADEPEVHTIRFWGASDGVMVLDTPTPTVTPSPTPTIPPPPEPTQAIAPGSTTGQWRVLVASIFPDWAVGPALAIIQCESGGNPWAIGYEGEMGLFQIHPYWHPDATFDPEGNARAAYRISRGGTDWSAWTCARVLYSYR